MNLSAAATDVLRIASARLPFCAVDVRDGLCLRNGVSVHGPRLSDKQHQRIQHTNASLVINVF